jgi:hypothetical protein
MFNNYHTSSSEFWSVAILLKEIMSQHPSSCEYVQICIFGYHFSCTGERVYYSCACRCTFRVCLSWSVYLVGATGSILHICIDTHTYVVHIHIVHIYMNTHTYIHSTYICSTYTHSTYIHEYTHTHIYIWSTCIHIKYIHRYMPSATRVGELLNLSRNQLRIMMELLIGTDNLWL